MYFAINNVANDQLVQVRLGPSRVAREHCAMAVTPHLVTFQLRRVQDFKIKCVIEIVTVIRDLVCQIGNLRLQRRVLVFLASHETVRTLVLPQAFAHLECQVQTWEIRVWPFKQLHRPHTLTIVIEPAVIAHAFGQHFLAGMSERRVPQIMRKRNRFRQILVQAQRAGDGAADRGDLDGMRQARAQMIASSVKKNLGLVFHAAERA